MVVVVASGSGGLGVVVRHNTMLQGRAKGLLDRGDARLMLWPSAVRDFHVSPVFGTGSATFLYYGRKFRDVRVRPTRCGRTTTIWSCWPSTGRSARRASCCSWARTCGGAGGRSASVPALWRGERRQQRGGVEHRLRSRPWRASPVHSVVDFNLHVPANALLMAFVFGQLANPGRALARRRSKLARLRPRRPSCRAWPWPRLSVWLLAEGMPKTAGRIPCRTGPRRPARRPSRSPPSTFAQPGRGDASPRTRSSITTWARPALHIAEHREATGAGPAPAIPSTRRIRRDALDAFRHASALAPGGQRRAHASGRNAHPPG